MEEAEAPKRNIWCGQYSFCLDAAMRSNVPFECTGCKYEEDASGDDEEADLFGSLLLVVAILRPELYHAYREAHGIQGEHDRTWRLSTLQAAVNRVTAPVAFP